MRENRTSGHTLTTHKSGDILLLGRTGDVDVPVGNRFQSINDRLSVDLTTVEVSAVRRMSGDSATVAACIERQRSERYADSYKAWLSR